MSPRRRSHSVVRTMLSAGSPRPSATNAGALPMSSFIQPKFMPKKPVQERDGKEDERYQGQPIDLVALALGDRRRIVLQDARPPLVANRGAAARYPRPGPRSSFNSAAPRASMPGTASTATIADRTALL